MEPSLRLKLNRLLLAIAGFSLVGFADSLYLTLDHYIGLPLPCTILDDCEVVLNHWTSMVGPIPLAVFGVVFYVVAMFFALFLYTSPTIPKLYAKGMLLITIAGLISSIIFEAIQAFVIHAFCQYCAISALMTLLMFICGVWFYKIFRADAGESVVSK